MLTKLKVRNFKRFEEVEIGLGETVVLIGPNNSGKTAGLQAVALWDIGVNGGIRSAEADSPPQSVPESPSTAAT
ncbi:MAG TPA: AAA family ATPase [Blastocatellia bacterium]|nr:AAA family ATPase [Blastocatellia bacterium]